MLLAGKSGSFRRSAVGFIGYLRGLEVKTCCLGKTYGIREFKRELKSWLEEVA